MEFGVDGYGYSISDMLLKTRCLWALLGASPDLDGNIYMVFHNHID